MLREEAAVEHLHGLHGSKVAPPAQKLALIVSIGIPVTLAALTVPEHAASIGSAEAAQHHANTNSKTCQVGMASALVSFSKTASHRVYIIVAGLMGCTGILCASFLQHVQHAPSLMAAILITHMLAAQLSEK